MIIRLLILRPPLEGTHLLQYCHVASHWCSIDIMPPVSSEKSTPGCLAYINAVGYIQLKEHVHFVPSVISP